MGEKGQGEYGQGRRGKSQVITRRSGDRAVRCGDIESPYRVLETETTDAMYQRDMTPRVDTGLLKTQHTRTSLVYKV